MLRLEIKPGAKGASALEALPENERKFLEKLISDYPQFRFCLNQRRFSFRAAENANAEKGSGTQKNAKKAKKREKSAKSTIFIGPPQPFFALQTLHELGHALCGHKDYSTHVMRLKIESEAWERAKTVLENYQKSALDLKKTDPAAAKALAGILPEWDQDYVEDCLDTYRDWLHTKSRCKKCGLTRYQTPDGEYHCPYCEAFTG